MGEVRHVRDRRRQGGGAAGVSKPRETLEAVIARHFPETARALAADCATSLAALKAPDLGRAELEGAARFGRWDAEKERERLKMLRQALRRAEAALDGLSPAVRTALLAAATDDVRSLPREEALAVARERRRRLPSGPYAAIREAKRALERDGGRPYHAAKRVADSGLPAGGQRDWHAVAVVEACRELWAERTGKLPSAWPRSNRSGDFLTFLGDVMRALEMKGRRGGPPSPLSAVRSWREAHNFGQKSRS